MNGAWESTAMLETEGFDDALQHAELLGFWDFSISWNSKY
jgi:hypothetical protein